MSHHVVVELGTAVKAVAAVMVAEEDIEEGAVAIVDNLGRHRARRRPSQTVRRVVYGVKLHGPFSASRRT